MSDIVTLVVPVTTVGSAGSASGSGSTGAIKGFLLDIYLDFHASAPGTTDITIALTGRGGNILARSDSAADGLFAPRQKPVDNANAAITNAFEKFALTDGLTISLAQCDALAPAVTAYIRVLTP